ncbi:Low density lipoprotein receptor adapter protein 1 [Mactra antiquata]
MDSLFRRVRKSPQAGKHSKLGEGWEVNREAVTEGVSFYLKYLGSTLLDELPQGESYASVSSRAVQRIVDMARTQARKLIKIVLKVTPQGIRAINMENKEAFLDVSIYRISFCTADKNHDKLFAFIARNSINETMECHAFYCAKQKIAQAVTISVSQSFTLAKDQWERSKNIKNSQKNTIHDNNKHGEDTNHLVPAVPPRKNQSAPILSEVHHSLPKPDSTKSLYTETRSSSPRQGWQTFDDTEDDSNVRFNLDSTDNEQVDDNLDDCFSQLAENRSRGNQSFPSFSTDLRSEDLDDSVNEYLDGTGCLEAFSRTKSNEDLFNI